ncbi:hypothetical protein BRADI_3g10937v3 [Brachypodium distachyon]|uniref:Chalcone-flavonone isomerase family protein n=1 Tax=Brachypodium distachyon TaxID=15368 RepID=A0A0Q3F8C7_BRADI|nr:hypothetical protein BRADI_3g10937v3 [Brachypodium distachyon]
MIVAASVVAVLPLAGPALARPAAAPLRTFPLSRGDVLAGSASRLACRCRVARGGARRPLISFAAGENAVGDAFVGEGATNVKFPRELTLPGYTEPLVILGTERSSLLKYMLLHSMWIIQLDLTLSNGKKRLALRASMLPQFSTPFLKALDDVIARRIKKPTVEEESSLSTFRNIFLGRNLRQGTGIYLTWLEPSRMLISISTNQDACQVDAETKSATVNYALYDGFFGGSPVSPTLKSSTAQLLEAILTN